MKRKALKILLWVLTIFMTVSALVFFPSVASIIMLLFAAIAIPLDPVRNFWKAKRLQGITKGILLVVLFFVAAGLTPNNKEDHSELLVDQQAQEINRNATDEVVHDEPVSKEDLIVDNQQETQPQEELPADIDSEPVSAPNELGPSAGEISDLEPVEIDPEPETEPAEVVSEPEQVKEEPKASNYVLNSGTMKFHKPNCSSVSDIKESNKVDFSGTREEVIAKGYAACKRCNP